MRTLRLLLTVFAVASFIVSGNVSAFAQAEALNCEQAFASFAGGKDYMNQQDFEQWWVDSGQERAGSLLNPEVGGSGNAFMSANTSNTGRLTKGEFCAWVNRR